MAEPMETENNEFEILYTEQQIQERVLELAQEISSDYSAEPEIDLLLAGVLKGATPFLTDLSRRINHPNILIDYIGVTSYGSGTVSSRDPKITYDLTMPIEGKHVILVEDIVDSGYSIRTLLDMLQTRKPRSLAVCALLSKPERREIAVPIDYLGFTIDGKDWVEGYGLDTNQRGRNLPYIIRRITE